MKTLYKAGVIGGTREDFEAEKERIRKRINNDTIEVTSITLNSLLERHKAPTEIDYVSLDTEGSELRILSAFDFSRWNVRIWSVEHNELHRSDGSSYLAALIDLMHRHGYSHELNTWNVYFLREGSR